MAPLTVIFVGFMVATWSYAGTLPMLVYYGMLLVAPAWLYAIAFFERSIVLCFRGMGSVASIGVALMGIGSGLHADLPILAAAIVTGAYLATNFHR